MVVSTAHITKQEDSDLRALCNPRSVEVPEWCDGESAEIFEYGFNLFVGCEEPYWRRASQHLQTLIMMAWASECHWLTLDCDGVIVAGLPEFDW